MTGIVLAPGGAATVAESAALARRVLSALPAHGYEMTALIGLLRIEASREVPTAAVSCERRPVLRINPDFVARHCRSDEHLFLLVLHELHHVLLGHTRLFPRPTLAHNLAFDALINALLCRRFPRRAFTGFFTGLYERQGWPLRLLAPPAPIADVPAPRLPADLAALHEALYGDGQVTAQEVFARVTEAVEALAGVGGAGDGGVKGEGDGGGGERRGGAGKGGRGEPDERGFGRGDPGDVERSARRRGGGAHLVGERKQAEEPPPLLGDHGAADAQGDDRWGTGGALDPGMVEAIRAIVERWPPPESPLRGRDLGGLLERRVVAPERALARDVRRAVRRALDLTALPLSGGRARPQVGPRPALIAQPNLTDRRGLVQREAGTPPLLWVGALADRRARDPEAIHVYLDVSGSMEPWMRRLYGALVAERRRLAPQVALFSTEVVTLPLAELLRGARPTTGGTSFDCVADHLLERRPRPRRVLLVTDGYVGRLDWSRQKRLEAAGIRLVVLLTPFGHRKDLQPLGATFVELPPSIKGGARA